jgi:hypothetical protein
MGRRARLSLEADYADKQQTNNKRYQRFHMTEHRPSESFARRLLHSNLRCVEQVRERDLRSRFPLSGEAPTGGFASKSILVVTSLVFNSCDFVDRFFCPKN